MMVNKHPLVKSNRLFIYLTDRCNYRCRHCYISKKKPSSDISFDMVLDILMWFKHKKPKLILLGGEPTLYPNLKEVICSAKSLGFKEIKIESNGGDSYITFAHKTKLDGINQVAFSIDGHN